MHCPEFTIIQKGMASGGARSSQYSTVLMDDVELPAIADIAVLLPADGVLQVQVTFNASRVEMRVPELPAGVTINVAASDPTVIAKQTADALRKAGVVD